jgi:PIN like domain
VIGLARALAAARDDVVHPGHPDLPEVRLGALDPDWLPVVANRDLVVLGRDRKIRRKAGERKLWLDHGLRVVELTGTRDMGTWQMLELVVKQWQRLERTIRDEAAGPWWASWTWSGITRRE